MEQADTTEQRHDPRKGYLKRARIVIAGGGRGQEPGQAGAVYAPLPAGASRR